MSDMPFDEPAQPETVLEYAIRVNPDEDWNLCSVCGSDGTQLTGPRAGLARGLVLLADGTLARSAWCHALSCTSERYMSTLIPKGMLP